MFELRNIMNMYWNDNETLGCNFPYCICISYVYVERRLLVWILPIYYTKLSDLLDPHQLSGISVVLQNRLQSSSSILISHPTVENRNSDAHKEM